MIYISVGVTLNWLMIKKKWFVHQFVCSGWVPRSGCNHCLHSQHFSSRNLGHRDGTPDWNGSRLDIMLLAIWSGLENEHGTVVKSVIGGIQGFFHVLFQFSFWVCLFRVLPKPSQTGSFSGVGIAFVFELNGLWTIPIVQLILSVWDDFLLNRS